MKAVVVIDGEHYVSVVRDALAALPYEVVGVFLAGGTEKLRGGEDYGVPFVDDFGGAEIVVDLSDEPVLGPRERLRLASRVLASGVPYVGADFRFDPPMFEPFPLPSLAVIGTGKRVGKTAFTGHVARLFARDRDVVVVAMGRGGPPEPELAEVKPGVEDLLRLSREGRHAASDYLETAALAGVVTIGCRRCGGGLAGFLRDEIHFERRERPRRRPPDVAPGQVVLPAVAVAGDAALLFGVADDAVEVRAGGGEGAEVGVADFDEDHRLGPEADDFVAFVEEEDLSVRIPEPLRRDHAKQRGFTGTGRTHHDGVPEI